MRDPVRWLFIFAGVFVLLLAMLSVKGCIDMNDAIDRCSDETSGAYIFDAVKRKAACG